MLKGIADVEPLVGAKKVPKQDGTLADEGPDLQQVAADTVLPLHGVDGIEHRGIVVQEPSRYLVVD
jgi:hypothetical protein